MHFIVWMTRTKKFQKKPMSFKTKLQSSVDKKNVLQLPFSNITDD